MGASLRGGGRGGGGGLMGGMGDPRQMMMREMMSRRGQESAPAMEFVDDEIYIVAGRSVKLLDAKTLEDRASAEIPLPAAEQERQDKMKQFMMKRFDRNADGFVDAKEAPNPDMIKKLDKDGDGKVSPAELPAPGGMAAKPAGPTTLEIKRGSVYVYQGGSLYRFDADDLALLAQAEIVKPAERGFDKERMMRERMKRGREGGEDRGRRKEGFDRERRGREEVPAGPKELERF